MAKIIDNPKKFRIIEMSLVEVNQAFGGLGVCDLCCTSPQTGYYIAVLNSWYCPECYNRWVKNAKRYAEDINTEERNFERVKERLSQLCN